MTRQFDAFSAVMSEASVPGEVAEPTALLAALRAIADPIELFSRSDDADDLFAALDSEFGFYRFFSPDMAPLEQEMRDRLASLVRWFVKELNQWSITEDKSQKKIIALFVISSSFGSNGDFWNFIDPVDPGNTHLVKYLKRFVSSFAVEFSPRMGSEIPIWEGEALEEFKAADAAADWFEIGTTWRPFDPLLSPSTFQTEVVRCLYNQAPSELVDALAGLNQTAIAMLVAKMLDIEKRLDIAAASTNPYVQFSFTYQTVSRGFSSRELLPHEQKLLTNLLLVVSADEPRWASWMRFFNRYPVRYPALQAPLGAALAIAPEAAITAYIDPISLSPLQTGADGCRQNVARCLKTFGEMAPPEQRSLLWGAAHKRWSEWRFSSEDPETSLFGIHWSSLDYAIVGFACECLDELGRTSAIEGIVSELQTIEDRWYPSQVEILTMWNRLLSQFQPYAHASEVIATGGDWYDERRYYLPFDPSMNEYFVVKFRSMRV